MSAYYDITILIPAKDEALRLPVFLNEALTFAHDFSGDAEIIVINDGSRDATAQIVLDHQKRYPDLKLIDLPQNRGKGFALKEGAAQANGSIVVFVDADGSTPINEINRYLHFFDQDVDIVIGSRVLLDKETRVDALMHRRFLGAIFNFFVKNFLMDDFKDTQCGFKMFRNHTLKELFDKIRLTGFGFDMELLYVAKHLELKIQEVPVNWHHVDGSKVSLVKDSFRMFVNIFQIKAWHQLPLENTKSANRIQELEELPLQD